MEKKELLMQGNEVRYLRRPVIILQLTSRFRKGNCTETIQDKVRVLYKSHMVRTAIKYKVVQI